ncbi:endolytic transglycosylase MltG [Catellatospora vulcania]|uniref:endolytic transglycosylase MltG n=1 Tax=Catellatospora vulcania TaxID=1460450 RepID=UPI0012D3EC67|nr:endolytic transglycosylase MltG [Catellatospora vulcania]
MTEEFFLAFGDEPEPHRPRRPADGRGRRNRRRRRRNRTVVAVMLTVFLLGGAGAAVYLGYDKVKGWLGTPDYTSAQDSAEVMLQIPENATGVQMAKVLKANDVIASEQAFLDAWEDNPKAATIQPGHYRLRVRLSAADAIVMLLDPARRVVKGVLVAEGLTSFEIYRLLAEKLGIPEAEFKAAGRDPVKLGVPESWFDRDGRKVTRSIEGFLFPDTYEFPPDVTAQGALKLMVRRFLDVAAELKFADSVRGGLKVAPYEMLIIASLAQAESGTTADLPKVARVAYNRIFEPRSGVCTCLEFDVTVNYWRLSKGLPRKDSKDMTSAEQNDKKNPYNHNVLFLPTPINNPGRAALAGAAKPTKADWYFFVAVDKQRNSAFSSTYAQFCEDNDIAVRNKVLARNSCD